MKKNPVFWKQIESGRTTKSMCKNYLLREWKSSDMVALLKPVRKEYII